MVTSTEPPVQIESPEYFVGVGASAGGLLAIESFFQNLPLDSDISFAIIQHLSPDFKSLMGEILARYTHIKIRRATDRMPIEKNCIYLIPPTQNMIVSNRKLLLSPREKGSPANLNLPINLFFRTLAQDFGDKSIAVLLSGSGSDGSRGAMEVSDAGGLVIAQSEDTAKFPSMPTSAVATGAVDKVMDPRQMVSFILSHVGYLQTQKTPSAATTNLDKVLLANEPLAAIFQLLKETYGVDFNYYRPTTIERRLDRRLTLSNCLSIDDYVRILENSPKELDILYHDLLIGVTRFFRDPAAFRKLENQVIPELLNKDSKKLQSVRIWTPGCATGEETYTLAILFHEYIKKHKLNAEVKIFATDLHKESLSRASHGTFHSEALGETSKERIENYFVKNPDDTYTASRTLRKMIVFAPQNVLTDPPFTRLDMIVCRNLLIYFESAVQEKVITLFHFALKIDRFLFLGPSESIGKLKNDFQSISNEWKLFQKKRDAAVLPTRGLLNRHPSSGDSAKPSTSISAKGPASRASSTIRLNTTLTWAYEALINDYADSGFLVDPDGEILHFFGDAHTFLKPMVGRTTSSLLKMVDQRLGQIIGASISRSLRDNKSVVYNDISIEHEGASILVQLETKPLRNERAKSDFLFITLSKAENDSDKKHVMVSPDSISIPGNDRLVDLETELQNTKESLQAANEELETTNEELQATNEELVASNEELQSTNEELQSSAEEMQSTNEELHSVNEELHTVNSEYQLKILELAQLSNDMENLLFSTAIGTIFLARDLTIRKFTPELTKSIHILPRDIGRPFEHISNKIHIQNKSDINKSIESVLSTHEPITEEVLLSDNLWMMMRILPYYDDENGVQGIVLTFTDITELKTSQIELKNKTAKLKATNQDLQDFSFVASHDLKAPLRQLKNYKELFMETIKVTPETEQVVAGIDKSVHQLDSLVSDLLEFSRVHSRGKSFQMTDCSDVLKTTIEPFEDQLKELGADLKLTLLPKLMVDPDQLSQLFSLLIDNAIKFRSKNPLKIKISAEHVGDSWNFCVSDNGVGIPENLLEDVFVIFRKGHTDPKLEGNGLGLAICRRIVERHGGGAWVESEVGIGTKVFFSLPIENS